jgi:hypothetical protein
MHSSVEENRKSLVRTRGRGFITGNVDSVHMLLIGTRQEILDDARRRITVGKEVVEHLNSARRNPQHKG